MATLYLVRHGEAAAGFDGHHDPGLSDHGRQQAAQAADTLAPLGPMPLVSSPLARARETAAPLETLWDTQARIETAIAEIPSPTDDLTARAGWLRTIMDKPWSALPPDLHAWRQGVVDTLLALPEDTILFSHFIAINVAVGAAVNAPSGAGGMIVFRPGNASITVLSTAGGELEVLKLGDQAETKVN